MKTSRKGRAHYRVRPFSTISDQTGLKTLSEVISKWCHRESNQGHKDFQSFALPLCISLRATTLAIFLSLRLKLFGKQRHAFWVKHYSLIYHCASLHLHPQLSYPPFVTMRGYQAL